jgi:hypothetical protein
VGSGWGQAAGPKCACQTRTVAKGGVGCLKRVGLTAVMPFLLEDALNTVRRRGALREGEGAVGEEGCGREGREVDHRAESSKRDGGGEGDLSCDF